MVSGEHDLGRLLSGLSPRLNGGAWVFCRMDAVPDGLEPLVLVREHEGVTVVIPRQRADELGLGYDLVTAWVTLEIHSALDAIGLTAAVSAALTDAGIPANGVAGFTHDHLFVPHDQADAAMQELRRLQRPR